MGWAGHRSVSKDWIISRERYRKFRRENKEYKDVPKAEWFKDCEDILEEIGHIIVTQPYGYKLKNNLGWFAVTTFIADSKYGIQDKTVPFVRWFKIGRGNKTFWQANLWDFKANRNLNIKAAKNIGKIKYNHYHQRDFSRLRKII